MNSALDLPSRILASVLALLLGAASLAMGADAAEADVRKSDRIMEETVEERAVPVTAAPSVDADYVMVVDSEGTVYFQRNVEERTHIASITKIMTAIVALENGELAQPITVSAAAVAVGESTAGLWEGDVMTLEMALQGLLVPSGNDAAVAIAETLGERFMAETGTQSAEAAFVAKMNETAARLGMTNTLFANPHGLDSDGHEGEMYSCAADVAVMCRYAMSSFPLFRSIVAQPQATIVLERFGEPIEVQLLSTDELIGIYEGACGIKTGFTDEAGACFAGVCHRDGVDLFAIVLHSPDELQRFVDTQTLWSWVYDNHVAYPLAHSDETASMMISGTLEEVPVVALAPAASWLDKTVEVTFADPAATVDVFTLNGNVSQRFFFDEVTGAIETGQKMGRAEFFQANELVATVDLVACEDVAAPELLEIASIAWERFTAAFTGAATVAEPTVINETPLIYNKQIAGFVGA